jgi:hypothetical protein
MRHIKTIFSILFAIIAVVGAYFTYQLGSTLMENNRKHFENERMLALKGVKTIAKVVKNKIVRLRNGDPIKDDNGNQLYNLDYQFEVEGKKYEGIAFNIGRTNPFEPIEIVYDPQSPENSHCPLQPATLEPSVSSVLPIFVIYFMFAAVIYQTIGSYLEKIASLY